MNDEFVVFVASRAPNLIALHLTGCKGVTDQSIGYLVGLPKLRRCSIHGTSITPEVEKALWKQLADR